jgi:hypothetical protein
LFEHQPGLFDTTGYEVESSVSLEIFELFVKSLRTKAKFRVTKENAGAISLLAKEFWLENLLSECSALQMPSVLELLTALSVRISKLTESVARHERQLESLSCRISALESNRSANLKAVKSFVSALQSPTEVEFRLQADKSINGIIRYLNQKQGGNVHDGGIVTIASKSVYHSDYAVQNVADLTSELWFQSKNEPGQWVCWDFHELRIRPTDYTMRAELLKSWVFESSVDGETWTEIDQRTENNDFIGSATASFAVAKSAECRFIRLTQTGDNHGEDDCLAIHGLEFFGTLLELRE